MIFIIAATFLDAERYARNYALPRSQWRCFFDVRQLAPFPRCEIWAFADWHRPERSEALKAACEAMGLEVQAKAPRVIGVPKVKKPYTGKRRGRKPRNGIIFKNT